MCLGADDAPGDDHEVLEADEGDEVWDDAHLGAHVEGEAGEAERHQNGAQGGDHGAKSNPDLPWVSFRIQSR